MSLGSGTYGNVQRDLENPNFAIKTVHFANLHSAVREVIILKKISHPNILKLFGVKINFQEFQINLSLKRYDTDLENFRNKNLKNMTPELIENFTQQIFAGMLYLHKNNIIHRDITPGNILVKTSYTGENSQIVGDKQKKNFNLVLCDFGLAVCKFDDSQKTFETNVCTSTYRAPEIYTGIPYLKYNDKVDIWSFGCVLFYLLTGSELMDWTNYKQFFKNKKKESSRYLCRCFKLPDYNNHLTRLKALKGLNREFLKAFYLRKLKKSNITQSLIDDYIDIIVDCLTPNPKFRLSSSELSEKFQQFKVPVQLNSRQSDKPIRLNTNSNNFNNTITEFSTFDKLIEGFDKELPVNRNFKIKALKELIQVAKTSDIMGNLEDSKNKGKQDGSIWRIGWKIYKRFINLQEDGDTEIFFSASLYIASLILEKEEEIFEEYLLAICSPIQFGFVVLYILHTLNWEIDENRA